VNTTRSRQCEYQGQGILETSASFVRSTRKYIREKASHHYAEGEGYSNMNGLFILKL